MDAIEVRLIKELNKAENGLSMWDAKKKLGISRDICRYRLEKLKDLGVLEKNGSKYDIQEDIGKFTIVGDVAIIERDGSISFLNCPYYGIDCECNGTKMKNCRLIQSLPYSISKDVLEKVGEEKELENIKE